MSKIVHENNTSIAVVPDCGVFSFYTESSSPNVTTINNSNLGWECEAELVNGVKIVPYGANNNLPELIRNVMEENNLAPGILEREIGLLWGQGPYLYTEEFENNQIVRKWGENTEIQTWLDSWDYHKYLNDVAVEFKHLKGHFTKFFKTRGHRIGRSQKIAKLECVPSIDARLGWVESRNIEDVKWIHTGNYEDNCSKGIKSYPVIDRFNPFRHHVFMSYTSAGSFSRVFYPVPGFYGALNWIRRSSDIPRIIKYLTDNSLNVAYHVKSPQGYWEKKKEEIEEKCSRDGKTYKDSMLEEKKTEILKKFTEVVTGMKNTGKMFHTISFHDDEGNLCEWQVEPIDQKIKDFVDAQIKISEKADSATTSGIGLHPSLSNIMVDGKLSSGSEMLYALKLYLASDTALPEMYITAEINKAIKLNFPGTKYKIGFYHQVVSQESEVTPNKRTKEAI